METDVLIVGGGLAGSVLAALLSRAGLQVRVLEPRQPPGDAEETGTDPRALAITPASRRVLEAAR